MVRSQIGSLSSEEIEDKVVTAIGQDSELKQGVRSSRSAVLRNGSGIAKIYKNSYKKRVIVNYWNNSKII